MHELDKEPEVRAEDQPPIKEYIFDPELCEAVEIGVGVEEWRVR